MEEKSEEVGGAEAQKERSTFAFKHYYH